MEWHPYAKLFPLLPDDRLQELADDIRQHGLRQAIVVDDQERIIDGRNRYRACKMAGVEPTLEPFVGNDEAVLRLVISLNLHRRHLNESQRAMIASDVANRKHGQRGPARQKDGAIAPSSDGVSQGEAADAFNVSRDSVKRASKVQEKGTPELQNAVIDGQVSVSKAAKLADLPPEQQVAEVEAAKAPKPKKPKAAVADVVELEVEAAPPAPSFDLAMASTVALRQIRQLFHQWPAEFRSQIADVLQSALEEDSTTW